MNPKEKPRGPWMHRALIYGFSLVLTLLLIWALAFVVNDIGRIPGPDYSKIEKQYVDQSLVDLVKNLEKQRVGIESQIKNQREIQELLRTSTRNSRETMTQLLEMRKQSLQQNVTPTGKEQEVLAESETRFLENQKKFQEANEKITSLSEEQRALREKLKETRDQIDSRKKPARKEYDKLKKRHAILVASLKLAVLVPLLLLTAWLVLRFKTSVYAPIARSALAASFLETAVVMHRYFPSEYFKYIAVGFSIAVVVAFLVHLIRLVSAPKKDWLLKQYKEAYRKGVCPVCAYPIERGGLRPALPPVRRGLQVVLLGSGETGGNKETAYVCPGCGEQLYEECDHCGEIRHSLLPHCRSCGHESRVGATEPVETT